MRTRERHQQRKDGVAVQPNIFRKRGTEPSASVISPDTPINSQLPPAYPMTRALRQNAVVQMQQTYGNHYVQRILAGKLGVSAQRSGGGELAGDTPGVETQALSMALSPQLQGNLPLPGTLVLPDTHNLTSPRFAGDKVLEACYDNEATLTIGMKGEAVQKVQKALVDLGYDLGPTGADGEYSSATHAAVHKFRGDEHFSPGLFNGLDGPTMGRLDKLFPPAPAEADFGDEGQLSCPTQDDVTTTVEARPDLLKSSAGPGSTADTHVSIAEAIKRFKEKVNVLDAASGSNISERGQFFWGRQLGLVVEAEIDRLAAEPKAAVFVGRARATFNHIMSFQDVPAHEWMQLVGMAQQSTSSEKPAMLALLHSGQSGMMTGLELWIMLNARPDNTLPDLKPWCSLPILAMLRQYEKRGCGSYVTMVAKRLKKKGGITAQNADVKPISVNLIGGNQIRDRRPMDSPLSTNEPDASKAVTHLSDVGLGDFFPQHNVLLAVAALRQALDAGQVILAHVMSGVGAGSNSSGFPDSHAKRFALRSMPPDEHWLLIIGYDGNEFVFHDPDAAVSQSPEAGFGTLFHDSRDNRLSTASQPEEMPVNALGRHKRGDKRYQVISLSTV